MPALVKLSRNVYDRLGDDVVTELVDWFNSMDASSHESLRELNELNFSRFDAKLEQRTAELRAEMKAGFVAADAKLAQCTAELRAEMKAGFVAADAKLEQRTAEFRADMKVGFVAADGKLEVRTAELGELIASSKANLLKWMVVMWATTLLAPFLANWAG